MRLIVMGTGPFAVPSCEALYRAGHEIALCVTRPVADPTAKKQPPRPVYEWALSRSLELYEPASINAEEAKAKLSTYNADLFFVCDYGQILSRACLSLTTLGGINLHGSILPRHRGAAPVQWALLRGDRVAGVSVIHMTPGLDAGPTLVIKQIDVLEDETSAGLEVRLSDLGVDAVLESLQMLAAWDGTANLGQKQDPTLVTKAPRFSKQDGQLDFRLSADYLARLVRACQPWPGTWAELLNEDGKVIRLIVRAARAVSYQEASLDEGETGSVAPVELSSESIGSKSTWRKTLGVRTADGVLLLGRVQPAGKREMDAVEFLRGCPIGSNSRFLLPDEPMKPLA